ncbi:MAG: FliM/FliN family flagellar motor switch protein, partial [Gammaproteobacteria bacterium]|nr:FliM/FliN family flagellar motor switch protein [Gammaproteobacteria bacterium]
ESLNRRLAGDASKFLEQMVNDDAEIRAASIETCSYGDYCDRIAKLALVVEFSAAPLTGSGLIYLKADLVRQLVESFYGGSGNEPADHPADMFTRGEISVASLFCNELLGCLAEVWQPLVDTEHQQLSAHLSSDIIDGIDASDAVICAEFEIEFSAHKFAFHIVWPTSMVASLLPVFEGQKRERDIAQDALWEHAIRSRIMDSIVAISSRVGHSEMTLGAVAELAPGDVIAIDDPRKSTVFVQQVPILEGQFGVHEGHYAIEAKEWLGAAPDNDA